MTIKKNDIITLEISAMTSEGSGIGKLDGLAVFVAGAAVGDVLEVLIIKTKKNYAIGKIHRIIKPSASRIESDCASFPSCGGCVYRHINYDEELNIKHDRVRDCIERIGGFKGLTVHPVVPSEKTEGYRNKSQLPIGVQNGSVITGFYANHTHRIVKSDGCKLHEIFFHDIEKAFTEWANENSVSVYNEETKRGLLRHLYIRYGEITGEIMVCIVANGEKLPAENELIETLIKTNSNIKSIILNTNTMDTNVILGEKCRTLYGNDHIYDVLCGLKFKLSPLSFYQINRKQAENLYNKAIEYAQLTGKETVLDLFCGTGTIGLCVSSKAKKVIGAEIVQDAINDAKENAKINNITNAEFICADADSAAQELHSRGIKPDVIIIDPPRKGGTETLIKTICDMAPERVVYVSCDPATLARDLKIFSGLGYTPQEVTPFDMFPRTAHVECVVRLCRNE